MNVLVLDDDPINLALIVHMLQPIPNIVCTEFSDPILALQWANAHKPDLLLIDYMMPRMDGLQFLKYLRRLPDCSVVPVIMVTATGGTDLRNMALESSATDLLTKPVNGTELRARVTNMLALRKVQLELAGHAAELTNEIREASAARLARELESIRCLSLAARSRDPETGAHLVRMSTYAQIIARELGLSEDEQNIIKEAAPLHDIGKVGIPDHILLKPGRLDAAEMTIMRTHAAIGAGILNASESPLLQVAATIALGHHEKFDGTGYPAGLKGEAIPFYARIAAVADVFDALTSPRPYKKAWQIDSAAKYIKENSSSHFDPQCVDAFLKNIDMVLLIHERYQDDPNIAMQ